MTLANVDARRVATALRFLADAFEPEAAAAPPTPPGAAPAAPEPPKRGRGRPVKGEDVPPPAPAAPSVPADDPFASPAVAQAPAPVATLEDVRKALTDLRAASTQEKALEVLKKSSGVDNITALTADKYGIVVAAANVELRVIETSKLAAAAADPFAAQTPTAPADPFAAPAAAAEKPPTLEDLKALLVETQKRTSQDTVMKVWMSHGGKGKDPNTGVEGPSFRALPVEKYAEVAKALKALPTTK